jgi:hypothetical protein
MQRELRDAYRTIANIGNMGLCNFCKFASFSGSCCNSELECEHPSPAVSDQENENDNIWGGGSDCWGFRTKLDLQTCAIQASILHDGNVPHLGRGNEWIAIVPTEEEKKRYDL